MRVLRICLALAALQAGNARADEPAIASIGWLHGTCLASASPDIAQGTEVQIVLLGEPQSAQVAKVLGKAEGAESCKPLMPGRSATVGGQPANLFLVSDWNLDQGDMAIGLIGGQPPLIEAGIAKATVDGTSGVVFSHCATSEGLRFNAWKGAPNRGTPLWEGYYGLDYDLEPSCP